MVWFEHFDNECPEEMLHDLKTYMIDEEALEALINDYEVTLMCNLRRYFKVIRQVASWMPTCLLPL